jgi:hypothetical protein
VRTDRVALLRGMSIAVNRERERRQAVEQAKAEAAWHEILDRLEEMARRFVALPRAGNRELAEQLARAPDWARVDQLRMLADLSRAESVALALTISPQAATRLLCEWPQRD